VFIFVRDRVQIELDGSVVCTALDSSWRQTGSVLHFHVVFLALAVVNNSQSDGRFGDFLAVRLFLELANPMRKGKTVNEGAR
jgi:hypothetical protein